MESHLPPAFELALLDDRGLVPDSLDRVLEVSRVGHLGIRRPLLILAEEAVAVLRRRVLPVGDDPYLDELEAIEFVPPVIPGVCTEDELVIGVDADDLDADHRGHLREDRTIAVPGGAGRCIRDLPLGGHRGFRRRGRRFGFGRRFLVGRRLGVVHRRRDAGRPILFADLAADQDRDDGEEEGNVTHVVSFDHGVGGLFTADCVSFVT